MLVVAVLLMVAAGVLSRRTAVPRDRTEVPVAKHIEETQEERVRRRDMIIAGSLAEELGEFGTVRMPWVAMPGEHPYSIHWRMGFGEGHLSVVWAWRRTLSPEQREDAVRAAGPVPADWAEWAATFIDAIGGEDEPPFDEVKALLAARNIPVTGMLSMGP